ncbi:MAG: SgcJ/EcaC family oxidoreductase [Roseinatronobacter sp.]|nr:SgcJ/EcaC family oxidoreductase [Roseinatronobacter sp.]
MPEDKSAEAAEIAALFQQWNDALQSGLAENVAALYAQDAILLGTFVNEILNTPAAITAYFANLMHRRPSSAIVSEHIRHFGDIALHSGLYEFSLNADTPEARLLARFTFAYRKGPEGWRIIEHHSSTLPQA